MAQDLFLSYAKLTSQPIESYSLDSVLPHARNWKIGQGVQGNVHHTQSVLRDFAATPCPPVFVTPSSCLNLPRQSMTGHGEGSLLQSSEG